MGLELDPAALDGASPAGGMVIDLDELERELALPGKPVQDIDDFEEVGHLSG